MLIGIAPVEVGVSFGVFLIVLLISHYVSLGSLSAAIAFPLTMFFRENVFLVDIEGYRTLIYFSIAISLLIIYTHRSNIGRLLRGTENRIHMFRLTRKNGNLASKAG
jgi:glycerol-3-phosphate acyltransferase PlsY